jgi:hypothetical protein
MKTSVAIYHWIPRILCILAILFISMFALDSFAPGLTIWQQISGFLIHLIPSFILLALLIVAWKWEFIGGLIIMLIGIIFIPFIYSHNYSMNHSVGISIGIVLMINIPFVLVGFLFLISHRMKKKLSQQA